MTAGIFTRKQFEQEEKKFLAPYAMKSAFSKGREYPEKEHDLRSSFQRDRDRVVHTNAFRRLEHKTQVFVILESDYYRTRLTHTMEVAQIARTLARNLRLNEDLTEAIALAHDLGHPPFGHFGESILNKLMENHGGFEHNRQSLHIVEEIENRYPDFPGLNLTWEVREGIAKHKSIYDQSTQTRFGTGFPTLEAQLVNLADEIAYTSHDQDDGIKSGLITIEGLSKLSLCKEALSKIPAGIFRKDRYQLTRNIINILSTDLLEQTIANLNRYKIHSVSDVNNCKVSLVAFSTKMEERKAELNAYLFKNLYKHTKLTHKEIESRKVLEDLFKIYTEKFDTLVPKEDRDKLKTSSKEQIVADRISGMTDRYAKEEYERLFKI